MIMCLARITVGIIVVLHTIPSVLAADFRIDDMETQITLSGEIAPGDAERLARIFLSIKPQGGAYFYPSSVYLDSPGGDVGEATRLAQLVRTLGLRVATVPGGKGVCASSCFIIYVAANERHATGIDAVRSKDSLSPVGVHRPRFRIAEDGPNGVAKQEQAMLTMRDFLAKSGVGQVLLDKMMASASNKIYWLSSADIRDLGTYSPGVEEQLIANCNYDADRDETLNAMEFAKSSKDGVLACVRRYTERHYGSLRESAIKRMRKGWRPWI